jgi:hypothetical protein
MIKAIRDLLMTSGGDGDHIPVGLITTSEREDADRMLEAWTEERGRSIECLLLLGRVHRLLCRIQAAGRLTDQAEREVKNLIRIINSIERDRPAIGS